MAKKKRSKSHKTGTKVRVAFRRNRARPAREKDWTHLEGAEATDADTAPLSENVVAKGDLSRNRTVIENEDPEMLAQLPTGVVVAMRGLIAEVDDGQRTWPCTVRRVLRTRRIEERNAVTVGDRVRFRIEAGDAGVHNEGVIEAVAPRHGVLTRVAGRRRHAVAANVDQVIIVASVVAPPLKAHLIDRYIVAAHHGQITPVICINKVDLDEVGEAEACLAIYRQLGYRTLATSVETNAGIEDLRNVLTRKCSTIAGQSGVGKSSLLNKVDVRLNLRVGGVSEETLKGRHTTTTAEMIKLDCGGYVVDTPGVRSFDVSVVPIAEIEMHFVEFGPHIPHCKFPDCTHIHETSCAVKSAVESGDINLDRYESYVRMFAERVPEY